MKPNYPLLQINIVEKNRFFTCNEWDSEPSIFIKAKGIALYKDGHFTDNIIRPATIELGLENYGIELTTIDLRAIIEITSQSGNILLTLEKGSHVIECLCSRIYTYPENNIYSRSNPILHFNNLYFICGGDELKSNNIKLIKKIGECKERNKKCMHCICDKFISPMWGLLFNWDAIKSIEVYDSIKVNGHSKTNFSNALIYKDWQWTSYKNGQRVKIEPEDIPPSTPTIFEGNSPDLESFTSHFPPPYNILFRTYISDFIRYINISIYYEERSRPHFVRGEGIYQECTVYSYRIHSTISFPSIYDLCQYCKSLQSLGYCIPAPEEPLNRVNFKSEQMTIINKSIENIADDLDVTFIYDVERHEEPA